MVYELRKGPLALLAEAAEADPLTPHIMIIDEINRANLPRVFGELLFLLEYRSHSVKTSYRPDEGFELPPNLYFIGTMNTADRSIALVDAALRRRFDFVPFMPHDGPMQGLLRRWLEAHDGPVWVADLVDRVNEDLRRALRGPHLQIGHSLLHAARARRRRGDAAPHLGLQRLPVHRGPALRPRARAGPVPVGERQGPLRPARRHPPVTSRDDT